MKYNKIRFLRWPILLYVAFCFVAIMGRQMKTRNAPAHTTNPARAQSEPAGDSSAHPANSTAAATQSAAAKARASSTSSALVSSATSTLAPSAGVESQDGVKVVASYFHGKFRCPTCRSIESQAQETIQQGLASLVAEGVLEWRVVDYDQPGQEHFMKDYNLTNQSLVISLQKNGKETRWKNLERVWELVHEPPKFSEYVQNETREMLGRK